MTEKKIKIEFTLLQEGTEMRLYTGIGKYNGTRNGLVHYIFSDDTSVSTLSVKDEEADPLRGTTAESFHTPQCPITIEITGEDLSITYLTQDNTFETCMIDITDQKEDLDNLYFGIGSYRNSEDIDYKVGWSGGNIPSEHLFNEDNWTWYNGYAPTFDNGWMSLGTVNMFTLASIGELLSDLELEETVQVEDGKASIENLFIPVTEYGEYIIHAKFKGTDTIEEGEGIGTLTINNPDGGGGITRRAPIQPVIEGCAT